MLVTSERPVSGLWSVVHITSLLLFHLLALSQANGDDLDLLSGGPRTTPTPWARDKYEEEAGQTFNLVFHKYNHLVRPPQEYVNVTVEVTLLHLGHVDVRRGEVQAVVGMELIWLDSRLTWIPDRVFQITGNTSTVWAPDIVLLNSVSPSQHLLPNLLRIKQDGTVAWTKKEVITTSCDLDPSSEDQTCYLKLGFMSNIRERQTDRFIRADTSKVITSEKFQNAEWDLSYVSFSYDTDNDTSLPSQMDIEITWKRSGNAPLFGEININSGSGGSGNPAYGTEGGESLCQQQHSADDGGGERNRAATTSQNGGCYISVALFFLFDAVLVPLFKGFPLQVWF